MHFKNLHKKLNSPNFQHILQSGILCVVIVEEYKRTNDKYNEIHTFILLRILNKWELIFGVNLIFTIGFNIKRQLKNFESREQSFLIFNANKNI